MEVIPKRVLIASEKDKTHLVEEQRPPIWREEGRYLSDGPEAEAHWRDGTEAQEETKWKDKGKK